MATTPLDAVLDILGASLAGAAQGDPTAVALAIAGLERDNPQGLDLGSLLIAYGYVFGQVLRHSARRLGATEADVWRGVVADIRGAS